MSVSSQWVALGGLAVAGLGIVVPWLTRKGDRKHTSAESTLTRAYERELAADERTYADRRDAYVDLVELTVRVAVGYSRAFAIGDLALLPPPPPLPEDLEAMRMDARIAVFGSDDVRARLDDWNSLRLATQSVLYRLQRVEDDVGQITAEQMQYLTDARAALISASLELDKAIRTDMNRSYS